MTKHNHQEDVIFVFGTLGALISLVTGAFVYLILLLNKLAYDVQLLGLAWMIFSGLIIVGMEFFERGHEKEAAWYLAVLGLLALPFAVGFFLGAAMIVLTSVLALKYAYQK